uniref:G_PROTEIN_RECEP_F1_2 domain-containing protein n=1 Tax=Onchocerca volvulus TaxID=6282 RepID=A0A8R1XNT6_ONCVO
MKRISENVCRWLAIKVIFWLLYGLLMIIGITGNGSVLIAFTKNRRLRSARNIFLLNLIITDLLLCVTAIPVTPWYALTKNWTFGALMCRLMPLSNSCSVFVTRQVSFHCSLSCSHEEASIFVVQNWSLTAIAIDKFVHIMGPIRAPVSISQAGLVTAFIWVISTVINIPYLLSYELVDGAYYVPNNTKPFCGFFCDEINWNGETPRRLYGSTVVLLQFVIPLIIITYCYARILAKVASDMIIQNVQFSKSLSTAQREKATNQRKRVNYILIGIVIAFIGCWFPLTVVNILKDFKLEPKFLLKQPFFWPLVAHVIAMSTVIWNPLLFFWLTKKKTKSQMPRFSVSFNAFGTTISRISSMHRKSYTFRYVHKYSSTCSLNRELSRRRNSSKSHLRNGLANSKNYLTVEMERLI